jgi:hypothetical protein
VVCNQVCLARGSLISWRLHEDDSLTVCDHGGNHEQPKASTTYHARSSYLEGTLSTCDV